jgi:hypothetical protein
MIIILQDCRTGNYLDETGGWTSCVQHAHDFKSSAEAMNVRCRQGVVEAMLIFRFEREGYSIRVPLEPLKGEAIPEPACAPACAEGPR